MAMYKHVAVLHLCTFVSKAGSQVEVVSRRKLYLASRHESAARQSDIKFGVPSVRHICEETFLYSPIGIRMKAMRKKS